jgi:hypothetical protein
MKGFDTPKPLFDDGFKIEKHKYVTIKAEGRSIYGRKVFFLLSHYLGRVLTH